MRINKRMAIKILRELALEYEVRIHITSSYLDFGFALYWNNSIMVSMNQSAPSMFSTFFHEIGHIYCWNNSLWTSYHCNKSYDHLTKKEKKKIIMTGLKAERWVDKWAKVEMKKHFPNIKYQPGYSTKEDGDSFLREIKKAMNYE
jgi:hypothetical protein